MKTKHIIIGISFLLLIYIVVFIFSTVVEKNNKITNLNKLRFSYTTGYSLNSYVVYEINNINGKYIVKVKPSSKEESKEYEVSKEKVDKVMNTLDKYNIYTWNGFRKVDKNVLDGNSFCLNIEYGNNKKIEASGYMRWPKNYSEIKKYLDKELGSLYK